MSWNPLKRLTGRPAGKETVTSPDGGDDIDELVSKYHKLEVDAKKLHKSAKKYEDTMLALYQSEKKLVGDLVNDDYCREQDDLRRIVEEWLCYASEMDQAVEEHVITTRRCLVDPLKRFQTTFPDVRDALKKREQLAQENARLVQKVAKLETKEATGNNIAKLAETRRQLETSTQEMDAQNALVRSELPEIYKLRIDYMQPSLRALVASERKHWEEAANRLQKCFPSLDATPQPSESEVSRLHKEKLNAIRALSIVNKPE